MLEIQLVVDPDLSKEELKELLQKIRDIEQREPSRLFHIGIKLPDWSKEDVLEVLRSVDPPFPKEIVKELPGQPKHSPEVA